MSVDARGFRHAEVADSYRALGGFLESDLSDLDEPVYVRVRRMAEDGLRGVLFGQVTSNSYDVTVEGNKTNISCLYDDDLFVEMSTEDFVGALDAYVDFMRQERP